jgi:protein TonB
MLLAAGHSWQQEGGVARWGGALATILALHVGAGLSGFIVWNHTEPPPPAAIMLELMPVPAAPPAPQVTAPPDPTPPPPEPEVDLAQPLPPIPELPLTPPDIPEVVLPTPEPEKKTVEEPKLEKPKEKPKREKVEKPKPKPDPEAEPEVVQKPTQQTVQQQAAKAAAPVQPSTAPAAPSAADVARVSAAKVTWQGILEAHLRKFQKYPRSALRRNVEGTALIRFRMDRDGKVLSYTIERTSEHEVLDEAALAMIERAQPLPPLPDEVPGDSIELIVPANFNLTDR